MRNGGIFFVLITMGLLVFPNIARGFRVWGTVEDANDCTCAAWRLVRLCCSSSTPVDGFVDPEDSTYFGWVDYEIGREVRAEVDMGDGYIAGPVSFKITGSGWDGQMPPMKLHKEGISVDPNYPDCPDCNDVDPPPILGHYVHQGWNGVSFSMFPLAYPNDINDPNEAVIIPIYPNLDPNVVVYNPNDTNNVEFPLRKGWNSFAYTDPEPFLWYRGIVTKNDPCDPNDPNTISVWHAAEEGWLELTAYFYSTSTGTYEYIPGNDYYFKRGKAYWLYALGDHLTLILPGVGGPLMTNSYKWWDSPQVYNGVQTKSLHEAHNANWLEEMIYYFDPNEQYYKLIPEEDQYIRPWKAYMIYSNEDLLLTFPEPDPCDLYDYSYDFDLKFHNIIVDANNEPVATGDTFNARYKSNDPNVSDANDIKDVRQPPSGPPYYPYVLAYTSPTTNPNPFAGFMVDCKKDVRKWLIRLVVYIYFGDPLTGTNRLTVLNPEEINNLPEDTMIYLVDHGSDPNGFVAELDVRDPNNHVYEFPVTDVSGLYRYIDLVITGCRDANIDQLNLVDFLDFSMMAPDWRETGLGLEGDVNRDGVVDLKDVAMLANFWLSDCSL